MQETGVDLLRISPQSKNSYEIIQHYHQVVTGKCEDADVRPYQTSPACDGYWRGETGMDYVATREV